MKKVLGLDLGTASIGGALVNEIDDNKSEIIDLFVRVNPLSSDEHSDFTKGKSTSVNANRTEKRGARRNLQRFKQRRKNLIKILIKAGIITDKTLLTEIGKDTTFQTLKLRAKSASKKVELEDLAKIFLAINKKRGYKSSRKVKNNEEGSLIDGMKVAKEMYDKNLTVGQYVYSLLKNEGKYIPDFYRSDLQNEFDKIWEFQKQFYYKILTTEVYAKLKNKNKTQTWAICKEPFKIVGIKRTTKGTEQKIENYKWRAEGLSKQLNLEQLAIVLQEINNNLNKSSGYLGAISDRSKELYFKKETVGENLYNQIEKDRHTSLKNQVFYRQDYLDEFEQIWKTQAKFHSELTEELKEEIRDVIIFYQRKLKSQKHLISECLFEKHHKSIPKSSPLFQEYKTWLAINNLEFLNIKTKEKYVLNDNDRDLLFEELNLRGDLKNSEIFKILKLKSKEWKLNFKKVEGNRTNAVLYNVYKQIADWEGYGYDWEKKTAKEIKIELKAIFSEIGIDSSILDFDAEINGNEFDKQKSYEFWHLLYSAEDDNKISAEDKLIYGDTDVLLKKQLEKKYGFEPKYGAMLASVSLENDYGSLSARAIKKIIPFLKAGNKYADACSYAKYNHSGFLTKEEQEKRPLKDKMDLLPKNSLRNPVVEKILNQMVNVVNEVIDTYGKPNEIRIELSRELKNSAKVRENITKNITSGTKANDEIKRIIKQDFGFTATKNDVIKYKLYKELKNNAYKTLYTNEYIEYNNLFSKEIEIEHIIAKAIKYDDSFSNKTLAYQKINTQKSDRTAFDFIENDYNNELDNYKKRVETLYNKGKGAIKKAKYEKLLIAEKDIPTDFIERDLKNSQYIAKKAKQLLLEVFRTVNTTTGQITSELRKDWGLINVMKELNLEKYKALGLTEIEKRKDEKEVEIITNWTKRNDHRHHAMDALTVAFTTYSHVQYFNNRNANSRKGVRFINLEKSITEIYSTKNGNKKKRVKRPMPNFRQEAKKHIENILISFKAKNKVVTKNKNFIKGQNKPKIELTPRGQLHKETVYGKIKQQMSKPTKLNKKISLQKIDLIINKEQKECVLLHLKQFNNNPKIAFDTKTIKKNPILYKNEPLKEVLCFEEIYTIRKPILPDIKIDKIIDKKIQTVLQNRLVEFGNDKKKAFSDIDKNPIWLNKEKGIAIKRVTINGVSNVEALHSKKDHLGNYILNKNGNKQAVDFVSTGNNHHVAIYKDKKGKLQEKVVSFYEAVARSNQNLDIIDKEFNKNIGWKFMFTMKQNEMFVFPNNDFDLNEIDLLDEKNACLISKHLFRIQKIGTKDYTFRHHLETVVTNNLKFTYRRISSTKSLEGIVKVRINHIGKIVHVGEY